MSIKKHFILYLLAACILISFSNHTVYATDSGTASPESPVIYTVTFNTRGGNTINSQKVPHLQTAMQPANPLKTGHTFGGWYTDTTFSTTFDFSIPITQDTKVYANWIANTYTVSFLTDGGTSIGSQSVKYGEKALEPQAPEKNNYVFAGWYKDTEFKNKFKFTYTIKGDTTLYAKWNILTYNVSFNTRGGNFISTQKIEHSKLATKPTDPVKNGYTFTGWYTDNTCTNSFDFSTQIMQETKLYAGWQPNTYTVSFLTDGGTSIVSQNIKYNEKAIEPEIPVKENYTFGGWFKDAEFKTKFKFTSAIKGDTTLYAKWNLITYNVSFNTRSGVFIPTQKIGYFQTATKPEDPKKTGHTFAGWYTDTTYTTPYDFTTPVTHEIKLYANWIINSYTLNFNTNGGTELQAQSVVYNTIATEPALPEKTGHTFGGWYRDKKFKTPFSFTTKIKKETTLYAKWIPNVYEVSFLSVGGSYTPPLEIPYGSCVTQPVTPVKTGHTFVGWFTDTKLTNLYDFSTPVTQEFRLYGKWKLQQYPVTFNSRGGSYIKTQNVNYKNTACVPEPPTKKGYDFAGWYTDNTFTTPYNFSTPVTSATRVYAKWKIHDYTVRFITRGGSFIPASHVPYMQVPQKPQEPTKKGYTFAGWYIDETYTIRYTFRYSIKEDLRLYAKWIPIEYTVKFNTTGGSYIAPQNVAYQQTATLPTPPVFETSTSRYIFAGWYKDRDYTEPFSFDTIIRKNTTIYAKWYKINVNKDKINVNVKSYAYGLKIKAANGDKISSLISSDTEIVKITKSGKIYGVKKGYATVTILTDLGSKKIISVYVK